MTTNEWRCPSCNCFEGDYHAEGCAELQRRIAKAREVEQLRKRAQLAQEAYEAAMKADRQ